MEKLFLILIICLSSNLFGAPPVEPSQVPLETPNTLSVKPNLMFILVAILLSSSFLIKSAEFSNFVARDMGVDQIVLPGSNKVYFKIYVKSIGIKNAKMISQTTVSIIQ
jgi:hypothetical protein